VEPPTQVVVVVLAETQILESLAAMAALVLSSFVTLHHKAHQRHLAVQTHLR
jgi:hypothetical protein